MHPDLKYVSEHLLKLGLGILCQAQRNVLYSSFGYAARIDEGVFGVIQTAQAAELIIKAAISQQHPLLIFSHLPKSNTVSGELLSIEDIFENAKTLQYSELPEKLWAVTGFKIFDIPLYNKFGNLRNTIQHFGVPDKDIRLESAIYIYNVIDPLLGHFWNDYAVNHVDVMEAKDDIFELLAEKKYLCSIP
ncbi:hypothetical protein [Aeromonas veronii]|uniref:hypothetical protein n=1 Tax=Aeromonas veronii TaxID=654 RepID=UPI002441F78F|nr:hypothetical protein [Aeromonas veronii]